MAAKIDINDGPMDMHESREQDPEELKAAAQSNNRASQGGLVPMQRMLTLEEAAERHREDSIRRSIHNQSNDAQREPDDA